MIKHIDINDVELHQKIKQEKIVYAGNSKLKIYGTLQCKSGKRMKKGNRVFFTSIVEIKINKFRPCGHCMRRDYKIWKNGLV